MGIRVMRAAPEPLRLSRLRSLITERSQISAKRTGRVLWNVDRGNAWDQAVGGQHRKRSKLCLIRWTIGDAGVLVEVFEGGEHPDLIFLDRAAESEYVVLLRKGLLGIGRGILDWIARIQA